MGLHLLTDDDVAVLKELITKVRGGYEPQIRPSLQETEQPTPETYIARSPIEGIPGINVQTGVTSGTGTGDTVSSAECTIWRISEGLMEKSSAQPQLIFNLGGDIEGDKWFVTHRTKDGVWIASSSSGTSMPFIRFEIYEANCESRFATAKVLSHGGSIPESFTIYGELEENEAGDIVESTFVLVYDKTGAFLNESNRNLYSRIGYAAYLTGRPKYPYQPWKGWEITNLTEQQTSCEAF